MKIAIFSAKPYDTEHLERFNTQHHLDFFETKLNEQTVRLTEGFDAICCFVNDTLNAAVIEVLAENGVRLVALRWDDQVEGEYAVELRIEVENRRGMIAVIATRINAMGVNIEKISTEDKDYQFTYVDLEMMVHNRVHLAKIMKRLRSTKSVRKVTRVKN